MEAAAQRNWKEILFSRKMLTCVFLGFTSGMPLWVLISLVPAWLRTEGVDLGTIGLFSLMTLPYTWKFVWSPLMDRYTPPFLGRRRGWALITQVVLLATIAALGLFDPGESLLPILALVFIVSFFSASQDIVIDAYRRELLDDDELGTGTSIHINAYRLSALVPGSLALILADHFSWTTVFAVTAVFMSVGIVMTLVIREVGELLAFLRTGRPVGHPENTTGISMPPSGGRPDWSDQQILDIIAHLRWLRDQHG